MTKVNLEKVKLLFEEFSNHLLLDIDRYQNGAKNSDNEVELAKWNGSVWVTNDIRSRLGGLLRDIQRLSSEDES